MAELGPVEENLAMLNLATKYFSTLASFHGRSKSVKFMAIMSSILERTAKKVIDKALKKATATTANKQKEKEGTIPSPVEQQSLPSEVDQPSELPISDPDLPSSAPFSGDSVTGGPGLTEPYAAELFAENAAFPYMVPMPGQNIQLTDAYTHMYNDYYRYDIPSFMAAPGPDAFWGQEVMPNIPGTIPNQMKSDSGMNNDAVLEYVWNNNG